MAATFLAFAESRDGDLRKVAFEAVTAARKAADASGGGEVHALLIGAPGIAARAADLGKLRRRCRGRRGARGARALQPRGLRRDGRRADQAPAAIAPAFFAGVGRRVGISRRASRRSCGVGLASDVTDVRDHGRRARRAASRRTPARSSSRCASPGQPALVSLRPGAITPAESAAVRESRSRRPRRWIRRPHAWS